jgi:endonuclease/exonuclease/phosphatase family metal-dependent hydrolase
LPIYNIPEDVHIIISGDFNDKETQYYIKGLHIQINQINQTNKVVKSIATPPKTCCLSHYTFIGDYILYSNNLNPIIDNTIFNYDKTNSDHYPVHVELDYKETQYQLLRIHQ